MHSLPSLKTLYSFDICAVTSKISYYPIFELSGDMSGSQLVARLLHITPSSTGSLSERGIVGVLQTPAASTSAQTVSFDRDRETSLLSPCRRRYSISPPLCSNHYGVGIYCLCYKHISMQSSR